MCIQYIISISSVERRGLPADGAGDRRAGSHHAAVPARVKTIYIYIYMYVCIYMYIYIYIHIYLCLCLSLSISLSLKNIYIYIYIYIYTHAYVYMATRRCPREPAAAIGKPRRERQRSERDRGKAEEAMQG